MRNVEILIFAVSGRILPPKYAVASGVPRLRSEAKTVTVLNRIGGGSELVTLEKKADPSDGGRPTPEEPNAPRTDSD